MLSIFNYIEYTRTRKRLTTCYIHYDTIVTTASKHLAIHHCPLVFSPIELTWCASVDALCRYDVASVYALGSYGVASVYMRSVAMVLPVCMRSVVMVLPVWMRSAVAMVLPVWNVDSIAHRWSSVWMRSVTMVLPVWNVDSIAHRWCQCGCARSLVMPVWMCYDPVWMYAAITGVASVGEVRLLIGVPNCGCVCSLCCQCGCDTITGVASVDVLRSLLLSLWIRSLTVGLSLWVRLLTGVVSLDALDRWCCQCGCVTITGVVSVDVLR